MNTAAYLNQEEVLYYIFRTSIYRQIPETVAQIMPRVYRYPLPLLLDFFGAHPQLAHQACFLLPLCFNYSNVSLL